MTAHAEALKALKKAHDRHSERSASLGTILDTLRSGYNPNYQDMAVLEAVRGWESLANLPHINDVRKGDAQSDVDAVVKTEETEPVLEPEVEEKEWSEAEVEAKLKELERQDFESLLLEHDKHAGDPTTDSMRERFLSSHVLSATKGPPDSL